MTLTTLIRALVTSFTKDAKDVWGAIVEEWNKRPDPKRHARTPPKNWDRPTPEADVPARNPNAKEVDLMAWTPDEILKMSEAEFRQKVGLTGVWTYEQAQREAAKAIKKRKDEN